jgi:hypothetical protein
MSRRQPVYDLFFGHDPSALATHPRGVGAPQEPKLSRPGAFRAGWAGGEGPGIDRDAWPRSPRTGFPMLHLFTLALPEPYRRRGDELSVVALFQADDHVAASTPDAGIALERGETTSSTAFFADLVRAHGARHPQAVALKDCIDGNFALLWLREDALACRTAPPSDERATVDLPATGLNLNAWDHASAELPIWLAEREFDPNAGKSPVEVWTDEDDDEDGRPDYVPSDHYEDVVLTRSAKLKSFYEEVHGRSHLGGTCLPVQAMPAGLTPYFLEVEDGVGGANFGGGNMQLDLESGVFDWAC